MALGSEGWLPESQVAVMAEREVSHKSKPGEVEVSKGHPQPEMVAAAVLILYMVLG